MHQDRLGTNIGKGDKEMRFFFAGIVAEYKSRGHDIALHDVNADAQWTEGDRWIWGIHFNSTGFEKMAASCALPPFSTLALS